MSSVFKVTCIKSNGYEYTGLQLSAGIMYHTSWLNRTLSTGK